ncbi:MAG: tRNA pseudouridine(55) synthase TruB [Microthrixaceae bacterium]|nr:tRNA pseudouridine(55) synthase TruB [Microthrixaceae bacterium]
MNADGNPDAPLGLCVVDKPSGWTSHDVVGRCRRIFGTRKIGHSGTLDPMATGVLVLGVGRATRLLTVLGGLPKTYEAVIRMGVETDSLDADGEVTVTHRMDAPDLEAGRAAARQLTGDLQQVPPMVSAKKVDGRRLHELARRGEVVERAPVPVTVTRFDVEATDDPMVVGAVVSCSAGTYVRVLASDLGHALGGGAHLVGLRRTAVGPFDLSDAATLEQLEADPSAHLLAPTAIERVMSCVVADPAVAGEVLHGRVLGRDRLGLGDDGDDTGPWAVLDPDRSRLLAVYAPHREGTVKPAFVLS